MASDEITIRPVELDDRDKGLFDVLAQLTNAPLLSAERFSELVFGQRVKGEHVTIVAEKEGRIIATGAVAIEQKMIRAGRPCGHIEDIVVDEASRGLQLGKKIIEELVKIAREKSCYKVILDCAENNVSFYEKCGFKIKGVQMALYYDS